MDMEKLILALRGRGFTVVNENATSGQVRLLGRVQPSDMPKWLAAVHHVLLVSEGKPWKVDISKQYFLVDGKLLFGWRIILQSSDPVASILGAVAGAVMAAPMPRTTVEEYTLAGATANRNALNRGRGAQSALHPVVGALATRG